MGGKRKIQNIGKQGQIVQKTELEITTGRQTDRYKNRHFTETDRKLEKMGRTK